MRGTYESEKHNKPEGATHYIEGTIDYLFTWVDLNSSKIYIGGGKWEDCRTICYKDLKPIPNGEVRKTIEQLEQENAQLKGLNAAYRLAYDLEKLSDEELQTFKIENKETIEKLFKLLRGNYE